MDKSKRDKSKRLFMGKSKRLFIKKKKSFRRGLSPIQSGDRIDYKNMSLLYKFLSQKGQILSRRVNKLTLKQQRSIAIAIKQARILSSLPFVTGTDLPLVKKEKKKFKKSESTTRTTTFKKEKKKFKKSESTTRTTTLKKKK